MTDRKDSTRVRWMVLSALVVGGVVSALVGMLFSVVGGLLSSEDSQLLRAVFSIPVELGGCIVNLGTELIGAGITYLLLERIIGRREAREAEKAAIEAEKAELIAQMDSSVRGNAVAAVEKLAGRRWLYDGSLRGEFFIEANLQGADLRGANLQNTYLIRANLRGRSTRLVGARLEWAVLAGADLQCANLEGCHLQRAVLTNADLEGAKLDLAELQGTILLGVNLKSAIGIAQCYCDENTVLPDKTRWTPDTDMSRFTDPDRPDFWRSDDHSSPAYRGNK